MNSQKTALALTEKKGCMCLVVWAALRVEGHHSKKAVDFLCLSICLSRKLSHQGSGRGGGHIHHHRATLWRSRRCCKDAQNILRKRPRQLSQISEVDQGYHVPLVKVAELVGEVAVEVMTVSSGAQIEASKGCHLGWPPQRHDSTAPR